MTDISEQVTLAIVTTVIREHGQRGLSLKDAMSYIWEKYNLDQVAAVLKDLGPEVRERLDAAFAQGTEEHRREWPVRYTLAPPSYDGFGIEDLGVTGYEAGRGRPYRRVGIDPRYYEWQTARYASGCHSAVDQAGLDQLHGFVKEKE